MNATLVRHYKTYSRLSGLISIIIGGLVILGWIFNNPVLKSIRPELTAMKANTALAFILCGLSLFLLHRQQDAPTGLILRVCASAVTLLAALTLLEYLFNWNLGIDQWLTQVLNATATTDRMSPATAFNFALLGPGLLLLYSSHNKLAQLLALIAGFVGLLSLLGYIYDVQTLYQIRGPSSTALPSAITFILLSLGLLLAQPESGVVSILSDGGVGGMLARRLLPTVIVVPVIIGWLRLQGQWAGLYDTNTGVSLFALSNIVFFTLVIGWFAYRLRRTDTERLGAEEALRKHDAHYRALVANAPDTIFTLDRDHRVAFISRGTAQPIESIEGHSTYELIPPEYHEAYRAAVNRVFEGSEREQIDLKTVLPDGQIRWYAVHFAPIRDEAQVVEVSAISSDVTWRKHAEEALRASEEQYRKLFKANPHPMVVIDLDSQTFIDANDAALEKYGYTRDEFIGMHGLKLRVPEDTADVPEHVRQIQQGDRDFIQSGVTRLVRKDGSILFAEVNSHRLIYQGRNAILSTTYDLTERLKAEEALRESQALLSQIFESVPVAIAITRVSDGTLLNVNDYFTHLTGYEKDEVVGKLAREIPIFVQSYDRQKVIRDTEQPGATHNRDYEWRSRTGEIIHILSSSKRITLGGELCILGIAMDITERTRAEESLRRSEELFSTIFQSVPVAIDISTIREGRLLNVNRQFLELTGYTEDELLDHTVEEIGLWNPATQRETLLQTIETIGFVSGAESQWKTKSGAVVDVLISVVPIEISGQACILAIGLDITQRKRAEAALRESEARLSGLFDSAMDAIITIDEQHTVVYFNAAAEMMFRCEKDEAIGQPISRFIPERFRAMHEEHIRMFARKGVTNRRMGALTAISGLRVNGEEFPVEASISQIEIASGKFHTVILRDITERKQAEDALRRSEELFSTVYQSVPVAIGIVSLTRGRTISVNNYMLQLTGFDETEIIERPIAELPYWTQPGQWEEALLPVVQDGSSRGVEMDWQTKSGTILHMIGSAAQIDVNGEPCLLGIALDITDRKQAERLRLEVYKERELLEIRERFISTISHEFRTPLAVILGAKESLEHYYDRLKPERRAEHFRNIDQQVQYLTNMLEEVLTLSRKHSGKTKFNPSWQNLAQVCHKLFEQVQLTDTKQHEFVWHDDGQVGEMPCDSVLLQHILINLLSNAIKYSPDGGKVTLAVSREEGKASIRVSDEGIGIPAEDQKHLFEPFHRASNTGKIKGTGLGLAIVKESVEEHGGTIGFETAEGAGTTFIVRLPLDQPALL